MALQLDDQTPAVSPAAREALVQAVLAAPSTESEPPWIEWKGPVDSLLGWAPRIALQLLGFANRPVEWAGRHMGGWGYLLLGVEPGTAHGITPVDTADLVKGVGPYLGTNGPQWDPHFIDVADVTALLISVPPPRSGDPIYPVRRSFQGASGGKQIDIKDGDVVIRSGSETRRARSEELDLLIARALARGSSLSVSVIDRSASFTTVDTRVEHRERWLRLERERLLAPLAASSPDTDAPADGISETARRLIIGLGIPSEADYRGEVEEYLETAVETWEARLTQFAATHRLAVLELEVRNETQRNFLGAELIVNIPGKVLAGWEGEWDWADLPTAPQVWGSRVPGLGMSMSRLPFRGPRLDSERIVPGGTGHIDNSASARIAFDEFDLRPEGNHVAELVFLRISEEHAGSPLEATWTLTSKTVDDIARGKLTFPVGSLTAVLAPTGGSSDVDPGVERQE